jgi:O-antigen/teichoic acid export membrane protein
MIPLLPARELGLYAVAVNLSTMTNLLAGQVGTVVAPRIAAGDRAVLSRAVRLSFLVTGLTGAIVTLASAVLVGPVFGSEFEPIRPMVALLAASATAAAGGTVLSRAFAAIGRPGVASLSEFVALAVTVPGLALLLRPLGGLGAALVSALAAIAASALLIALARGEFRSRAVDYLIVRPDDVRVAVSRLGGRMRRTKTR